MPKTLNWRFLLKILVALFALMYLSLSSGPAQCDAGFPVASPSPHAVVVAAPSPKPADSVMVSVAEPSAPPQWAQELMVSAQKLPVVGPVVSKALLLLGIVGSIITMLAGFLMGSISVLKGAFNWAGLAGASAAIVSFQNSKFVYWLKFFSMFNAQKDDLTAEKKSPDAK